MSSKSLELAEKLKKIIAKQQELETKIVDPGKLAHEEFVSLSKEYSDRTHLVAIAKEYLSVIQEQADLHILLEDKEMQAIAEEELLAIDKRLPLLEREIQIALIPKDKDDEKNAILEVRAGTGGDEAALFAAELFEMYQRYADRRGWKFEIMSLSETGTGGYKEASASISGKGVFARLKYESGVHRVQRVPATESSGRVHTSAATVAVLPEAEEVDIHIDEKDLRIDIFRSSGPGGQSVNTTDSAVRITHIPTGVVVSQQDEKSQHKNRAKAMKILRSRIYEAERSKRDAERALQRKGQVGSGDRSERIRTYNFPQRRVSDHRINLTLYRIEEIVKQGDLDELIEALIADDQASIMAASE